MAENEKLEAVKGAEVKEEKKSDKEVSKKAANKNKVPLKERLGRFFREYRSELKKIVWYGREQTFRSSVVVVISIVVTSACVGGLDWVFSKLLMWLGTLI